MRQPIPIVFWASLFLTCAGCTETVEPGHRGLLFQPWKGGLSRHVLPPGRYYVGPHGRIDDFDVTYSTRSETMNTISSEGLALGVKMSVIFRPVVTQLYELDVEIGRNYYDEVIGPEFKTAARGVFARHSYLELQRNNAKIEEEIRDDVRRRIAGRYVEVSSVTMEELRYAPEIAEAIRAKLVGEQEAARRKVALEADAQRQSTELHHQAERAKLEAEAQLLHKQNERELAEEQAHIDRVKAETEAATQVIRAKSQAEQEILLAKAHGEERKAQALALTPLSVMMHAYDALAKLGGQGTTIMLGDFSKVPNFLFPPNLFPHLAEQK
jgi:regulator of protease activity HflC (stomatin/prohibitin superfamily)